MWFILAILSAFFAALTSILAKLGMSDISSNLATAVRTTVVLFMAWGMVALTGTGNQLQNLTTKDWIFLVLSGIATGLSWLCYYKAIQIGEVSKVVPIDKFSIVITIVLAAIILKEALSLKVILGTFFITIGTFIMIL